MSLIKDWYRRQRVIFFWLISYLSILIIPVLFSGIVFYESSKVIENEINNTNNNQLKQARNVIDNHLREIDALFMQISMNPKLKELINFTGTYQNDQYFEIYQIIKDFKIYHAANMSVKNFYIYLLKSGTALASNGVWDEKMLFNHLNMHEQLNYNEWKEFFRERHINNFVPMDRNEYGIGVKHTVAYIRTIFSEDYNKQLATAIITVDEDILLQAMENTELVKSGIVAIIDKDNNIVASTRHIFNMSQYIGYDELAEENELLYKNIEGKTIVISHIKSQVNNWKLVSVFYEENFGLKVKKIQNLIIICILLSLTIGSLAAFVFTKRNYYPVKKLVEIVVNKLGNSIGNKSDAYNFIQEALSKTIEEKVYIHQKLDEQDNLIRSGFLSQLLEGQYKNISSIDKLLLQYNISFVSDNFFVMLFYIEDYDIFFPDDTDISEKEKLKIIQLIVTNVVEKLSGQNKRVFMTKVDGLLTLLVNHNNGNSMDEKQKILQIIYDAKRFMFENFQINLKISFSEIYENINEIWKAYIEAVETMQYIITTRKDDVVCYGDIKGLNCKYYYSLQNEQQLLNCIRTGDIVRSQAILDEVIRKNYEETSLPIHMAKRLMFNLTSTMIIALDEVRNYCDQELITKVNPVERLLNCRTVMEMKLEMMDMLKDICEYMKGANNGGNDTFVDNVVNFIKKNYWDINFSISTIGDKFDMTSAYISKLFREKTGEGLIGYINKIRIEQAKLLLSEQKFTIFEIAKKVGYSDYNTFNRQFKNYEGITPGKYRGIY